jgi:hypothetical protein
MGKEIISIRNGDGAYARSWFGDHIERKVGNDESTSFWKNEWLDKKSLKSQFGRVFYVFKKRCVGGGYEKVGMRARW